MRRRRHIESACEIAILAGGLSKRMGRDKASLRLGGRSLVSHIKEAARASGLPVRVIRRDLVPRCGPLGGIYTALRQTSADRLLFLACDMPFVTSDLIGYMLERRGALFISLGERSGQAGFPFLLPKSALATVEKQIREKRLSLQALAQALEGKIIAVPRRFASQLRNVNTPEEWALARRAWRQERGRILS